MLIYLGELQHAAMTGSPGHFVPLAVGYLASYLKKHSPGVEVRIFNRADALLDAVDEKQPDIVGLSVRFWSEKLSLFCAKTIKERYPETVMVAGGPNVDDVDSEIIDFLRRHSFFDVCIPNEGEVGMLSLVQSLQENGGLNPDQAITSCCTLGSDDVLRKGKYLTPNLEEIPSPYLDGTLDHFLEAGFDVLTQTTRGCPYRCKFCVDGSNLTSKVRRVPMDQVVAEFEYIRTRATSEFMMITDLNFGIMGKRDVEIAKMVNRSFKAGGFPRIFSAYSFKYLNENNREIAFMFKDQAERTIAFQSMDAAVVEEVGRYNLKFEDFKNDLAWATEKGVRLNAEFIFGLAGEKTDSFIDSIEKLIRHGANRILLHNLKLIAGSDLAMTSYREKYKFKSKFRRFGRNYGIYRGQPIIETEEIVTDADTFDFAAFVEVRRYGLFLNLSLMLGYLLELIKILIRIELPGEKLVAFLASEAITHGEHLSALMAEYHERINSELFDTHDEAVRREIAVLKKNGKLRETRLDWIFVGKMITNPQIIADLFDLIRTFVRNQNADEATRQLVDDYLANVLSKQIISFSRDEPEVIRVTSRVDLEKLSSTGPVPPSVLLSEDLKEYELRLPEPAANFIRKNAFSESGPDEAALQDIFVRLADTSDNCLLRSRSQISGHSTTLVH